MPIPSLRFNSDNKSFNFFREDLTASRYIMTPDDFVKTLTDVCAHVHGVLLDFIRHLHRARMSFFLNRVVFFLHVIIHNLMHAFLRLITILKNAGPIYWLHNFKNVRAAVRSCSIFADNSSPKVKSGESVERSDLAYLIFLRSLVVTSRNTSMISCSLVLGISMRLNGTFRSRKNPSYIQGRYQKMRVACIWLLKSERACVIKV